MKPESFGPAYDEAVDGKRIRRQMDVIRDFMISAPAHLTLAEISRVLGFPEASVSAQLRHLKKEQHGSYQLEKRRRREGGGTWEYQMLPPLVEEPAPQELPFP